METLIRNKVGAYFSRQTCEFYAMDDFGNLVSLETYTGALCLFDVTMYSIFGE